MALIRVTTDHYIRNYSVCITLERSTSSICMLKCVRNICLYKMDGIFYIVDDAQVQLTFYLTVLFNKLCTKKLPFLLQFSFFSKVLIEQQLLQHLPRHRFHYNPLNTSYDTTSFVNPRAMYSVKTPWENLT